MVGHVSVLLVGAAAAHAARILGLSLPCSAGLLAILLFARLLHGRGVKKHQHTLYLRDIKNPEILTGGQSLKNVFCDEFLTMFEFVAHVLDLAVMKYVDSAVPMLAKQEQRHAKLHLTVQRNHHNHVQRWEWFRKLADLALLRMGPKLGRSLCGHIEAASPELAYLPVALPFCKGFATNLYVFHAMEETEHQALTVQSLGRVSGPLLGAATLPLVALFLFVWFLLPPVVRLCLEPKRLLNAATYPDLVRYYLAFTPAYWLTLWSAAVHWVLRLPLDHGETAQRKSTLLQWLHERGVETSVIDQAAYSLEI
eukprot:CAMPEP_0171069276 /NCGR_PEP_ID=MMETSP0766_2-20121228/9050_1 /TAXON_ID=439317 /ORGANISM="Gambierdiscus australes, Strain CAWD 149" /LENGTH=309 /DNA_ID=CAMNT_0011525651 /DNA_START=60 /DNA_END=989 /DNA_ORIENTATION=+